MVISKYGFFDVLEPGTVVLDPSRVAAQIVSGIGFIGAGLIFVRRDSVRGLTTAAGIWLTAAIGAACGASLTLLAIATTLAYFVVVFVIFADVNLDRPEGDPHAGHPGAGSVALEVHGPGSVAGLAAELGEIEGVLSVAAGDVNEMFD